MSGRTGAFLRTGRRITAVASAALSDNSADTTAPQAERHRETEDA